MQNLPFLHSFQTLLPLKLVALSSKRSGQTSVCLLWDITEILHFHSNFYKRSLLVLNLIQECSKRNIFLITRLSVQIWPEWPEVNHKSILGKFKIWIQILHQNVKMVFHYICSFYGIFQWLLPGGVASNLFNGLW